MSINDLRDIPNLAFWCSSDYDKTQYAAGAEVTTLHDRSGNGNHATATPAVNVAPLMRYTGGPGNGPYFEGPSTGYRWELPDAIFAGMTQAEVFIVLKSLGASRGPIGAFGGSDQYYPFSDGNVYSDAFSNLRPGFSVAAKPVNVWRRLNIWSVSGDWSFNLDETAMNTMAGGHVFQAGTGKWLGTSVNGGNPAGVHISAAAIWKRKLTAPERLDAITWFTTHASGGDQFAGLPPVVSSNSVNDLYRIQLGAGSSSISHSKIEQDFWSSLSGLLPVSSFSISDHKKAALAAIGSGSISDRFRVYLDAQGLTGTGNSNTDKEFDWLGGV